MKSKIIWIVLLTMLTATVLFLALQMKDVANPFEKESVQQVATSSTPLTFDQATVYTCNDGSFVAAAFKTGDTTVIEVSLPNNNPLVMSQVQAASGARYEHESGVAFWEQGGTVMIENNGEVVYANCKVGQLTALEENASSTNELAGTQWIWAQTNFATGTSTEPNQPEDFVITFSENNSFSANTDCNNVGGEFVGGNDGAVSFKDMVSTLMACTGDTKEAAFVNQLTQVVSYRLEESELTLSLKSNTENGEMKFTKK